MKPILLAAAASGLFFCAVNSAAWSADADGKAEKNPKTMSDQSASGTPAEWNLTDLYPSPQSWQQAYDKLEPRIEKLSQLQNTLTDSPEALAKALKQINAVEKSAARLSVYAGLRADQDLRDSKTQERRAQATRLLAHYQEATGFVRPALIGMDQGKLRQWIDNPALSVNKRFLDNVMREAPHTLSKSTESALAALSPVTTTDTTYSLLANSDIDWPTLKIDGRQRTLDQSGYTKWRGDPDRGVRKQVFNAFWPAWRQYEATFGSLLGNQVLEHVIEARLRHYDSALAAALSPDEIPVAVYRQLIDSVHAHLPTLHRYLKLRQRMLGVDQLHYYDIYPPLVKSQRDFNIKDARKLTIQATKALGPHYAELFAKATGAPWTSVYPARGKRSGAYMNGAAYAVHPYVLMNFNDDYESVSTYAHEWGHGIHSMLANEAQPYETADYPIFTAEVASTTNENLLNEQMIKNAKTDQQKLFYIGQALEQLRGTFFRQAQFAEFELAIHQAAAKGEPLSGQRMTQMYGNIVKQYYGVDKGVTAIDPKYFIEWAYIPHFYYDFYVYQYATSITAGHYFASRISDGDAKVRQAYLKVLSSGGAASGYRLLKNAGVDLASAAPYDALMTYMDGLIDRAQAILDKQEK